MGTKRRGDLGYRVEKTLERCLEWSQAGRHRRVLTEVERILPRVARHPLLEAHVLIWKAQALLSMGCADRALPAASRSWDLQSSPHACHLMCNALNALGESDQAEEMLRMGWDLFPEAVHLPVQLAMILADQGRLPEALQTLDDIPPDSRLPEDLRAFVVGFRANMMASMGRWSDADRLLRDSLGQDPSSPILREAHDSINRAWQRNRAERDLVQSWSKGLRALSGEPAEVDDAVLRCGAVTEASELEVVAARRLWRALIDARPTRPQSPEPWGAALLVAVLELDGQQPNVSAMARATRTNASTVRAALARVRTFLAGMDRGLAHRAFGADSNPLLDRDPDACRQRYPAATVIPFPNP